MSEMAVAKCTIKSPFNSATNLMSSIDIMYAMNVELPSAKL